MVLAAGVAAGLFAPGGPLSSRSGGAVVGVAMIGSQTGWMVTSGGAVESVGRALTYGSAHLGSGDPAVGITATPDGRGYWVVTVRGRVLPFGNARFYGDVFWPYRHLRQRIVALVASPKGNGYWLTGSGGGVFAYGGAGWFGSPANRHYGGHWIGLAPSVGGHGYFMLDSAGRVSAFGAARWAGPSRSRGFKSPPVGIVASAGGSGYWVATRSGLVEAFGMRGKVGTSRSGLAPLAGMAPDSGGYALFNQRGEVGVGGGPPVVQGPIVRPIGAPSKPPAPAPPSTPTTTTLPTTTTTLPTTTTTLPTTTTTLPTTTTTLPTTTTTTPSGPPASPVPPSAPTTTVPVTTTTTVPAGSSSTLQPLSFGMFAQSLPEQSTVLAQSGEYVSAFVQDYETDYGGVGVNAVGLKGMPIWTVPADQPLVPISVQAGCNNFTVSTGTEIPIPPGVTTMGVDDSPLVIYQPSTGTDWELWKAVQNSDGSWSACWGGKLDTATSDGVFPSNYGLSASGISYLATTITEADIASGSIDHAIAVDLPVCDSPEAAPADRTDCGSNPGQPHEGTWYRFPASLSMPEGLTPFGQMVFKAIQDYGMVVVDQAGAVMLQAEDTSDWTAQGHTGPNPILQSWDGEAEYQVVANLPWNDLEAISAP